jgi:nicotinate-nucleotide--dimethylbenzimidazole phosphoribosyltransferase
VSAFPAEVSAQMVANFLSGGAAISVLSRQQNADFAVVNMGLLQKLDNAPKLINLELAHGTEDFTVTKAMSRHCMQACLEAGKKQVNELNCQLFIAGEMGIGNTSSASAIIAALLNYNAKDVVGRGTGIDGETLIRKQIAVGKALQLHSDNLEKPLDVLQCVGGLEIAAMVGAYIRSAQRGIPIVLDGFISCTAALVAVTINPSAKAWMIAGHQSAEAAHERLLDALDLRPIINLEMCLGEGSGAAIALPIIHSALLLHAQMFTFEEAGIAGAKP